MSTLSPRVGLTVMQDTDFVSPFTVTGDNALLDTLTSITQCTSTSRPGAPFDGQWIYETDLQNLRRWSQADGKWYLRGGSGVACASGLIAQFSDGNAHQIAGNSGSAATVSLHDYNLNLPNGHMYKIIEQGWFNMTGTYQQNHGDFVMPEFYTTFAVGAQQGLGDANSLHYFQQPYQQNFNPCRKPYYKVFGFPVNGNPGIGQTTSCYFRSVMRVDSTRYQSGQLLGRPSTSFAAKAYIYDLGVIGVN